MNIQDINFAPFLFLNNNDSIKFDIKNMNNDKNIDGYKIIKEKLLSENNIEYIQKKLIETVY
jgi:hypothetical protein